VSIACGSLHSAAVTADGRVYEWGLLFEAFDQALPGEEGNHHALVGMANRLERNEYLRRIVMRSEAAYLANRDVAEVSSEGTGGGGTAAGARPTVSAAEVLRLKVKRVVIAKPRVVAGLAGVLVRKIACGYAHSVLLDTLGRMFSCGYNDRGQLGVGNRIASGSYKIIDAASVASERIVAVACGQQHNVASSDTGKVFTWGSGTLGQLGLDSVGDRLMPHSLDAFPEDDAFIVDVACGSNHSMVLSRLGVVYGFGHSEYQQMGDGEAGADLVHAARYYYVPRKIVGLNRFRVRQIAAGGQFSLALLADGSVVSWGWDAFNCLGRGEELDAASAAFARVSGLQGRQASSISCGYHHAVACVVPDGNPYAASWLPMFRAFNKQLDSAVLRTLEEASTEGVQGSAAALAATSKFRHRNGHVDSGTPEEPLLEALVLSDTDHLQNTRADLPSPRKEEVFVPPDVILVGTRLKQTVHVTAGAISAPSPSTTNVVSAKMLSLRQQLASSIDKLGGKRAVPGGSTTGSGTVALTRAGADVMSAEAFTEEEVVKCHSVVLAYRCPIIGRAMAAIRARWMAKGRPVDVQADCVSMDSARGCSEVRIEFAPTTQLWTVTVAGVGRWVLTAFAAFLYSDTLIHFPSHRVSQLKLLADGLCLGRLASLCEKLLHAYDRESPGLLGTSGLPSLGESTHTSPVASVFTENMVCALTDDALADTELHVCASSLDAAALILKVHSPVICRIEYFSKLLHGGFGDAVTLLESGRRQIRLLDVDCSAVQDLIHYLYTGDLAEISVDAERCMSLLALASEWCIGEVICKTQDIIMQRMSPDDASICQDFADTYNLPRLKRFAAALLPAARLASA
jgi:alpha-tubulin suppressor-like RCC1 family protein